jgi:ribosomal protein S18 acetylase RimI-like enzyme
MELFVRPAGPADAEEIAEVQRQSWQAAYATLMSADSLARAQAAWGAEHWRRSLERTASLGIPLVIEAERPGIVGFAVGGPRRGSRDPRLQHFAAEIYLLYLLPAFQGMGLGARLMTAMARVLLARGMDSALVWALADNHRAVGFYQHLAGSIVMECRKPFFGESLNEIALGWRDLSSLAELSWKLRG